MNLKAKMLTLAAAALLVSGSAPAIADEAGLESFTRMQKHIVEVSDQLKSSVVHIEVMSRRNSEHRKGLGSGLIISEDGRIVTNYHVIDRAQSITVILDDKTKHPAEIVRSDAQTDLAVIKIKADRKLSPAKLGDSGNVQVGEWVLAIGNPYGFDRTVSFGIVSGKGRFIPGINNTDVPIINDFIQTDALIDPGNSGGPLVNMHGEVIGINSVGIGRGQGFTIPSNIVKEVLNRSEVEGRIKRGWLGIALQAFTPEHAEYLNKPELRGVLVSDTVKGGPAQKAGILSGDIITEINGEEIDASTKEAIQRCILTVTTIEPGTNANVKIFRDGKLISLKVPIGTQPPMSSKEADTDYGMTVKGITSAMADDERLTTDKGVMISHITPGTAADAAGLSVKDVIVKIDRTPVTDLESFKTASKQASKNDRFLITVKRGNSTYYGLIDQKPYKKAKDSDDKK